MVSFGFGQTGSERLPGVRRDEVMELWTAECDRRHMHSARRTGLLHSAVSVSLHHHPGFDQMDSTGLSQSNGVSDPRSQVVIHT